MSVAIELEDVSFGFRPGQRVLEDVSLRVGEGEFVAIAGPNGGGKTTLVRIVLGLERPSSGRALLYGEIAVRFSGRRRLGYLAQRSDLGGDAPVTVREVVSAGRLAAGRVFGPMRRHDRELVAEAIERVGLGHVKKRPTCRSPSKLLRLGGLNFGSADRKMNASGGARLRRRHF